MMNEGPNRLDNVTKIGGHLRFGDGPRFVPVEAHGMGYNVVQIMVGGKTDYNPYDITDAVADEYRKRMYGIDTYVHMPFILNPCDKSKRGWVKMTLRKFVKASRNLGARAIVIHPGFKKDLPEKEAFQNLVEFFRTCLEEDAQIPMLIETDSGSQNGSAIGTPAFIWEAIKEIDSDDVAMCIDTEHLWARGSVNCWNADELGLFLSVYGEKIKLVHLNVPDPGVQYGSFVDRHNSPFEEFSLDSAEMVRTLTKRFPCILERSSLSIQAQDVAYIRRVLDSSGSPEELAVIEEEPQLQD